MARSLPQKKVKEMDKIRNNKEETTSPIKSDVRRTCKVHTLSDLSLSFEEIVLSFEKTKAVSTATFEKLHRNVRHHAVKSVNHSADEVFPAKN
jgi:hypothetical protein